MSRKQELEERKLEIEIRHLERKWFRNPATLAALLPTLIALASIIYAFSNGLISVSKERVANQVTLLEYRKAQLLDAEALLKEETDRLKAERTELEAEKQAIEAEIEALKLEARVSRVSVPLAALREEGQTIWPLNENFDALIRALADEPVPEAVGLIEDAIEATGEADMKANLLRALFLGTREEKYHALLNQLTREHAAEAGFHYWEVYSNSRFFRWGDAEDRKNTELLMDLAAQEGAAVLDQGRFVDQLAGMLHEFGGSGLSVARAHRACNAILATAIDSALDQARPHYDRSDFVKLVIALSPETGASLFGWIVVSEPRNVDLLSALQSGLVWGAVTERLFEPFNAPRGTNEADWRQWMAARSWKIDAAYFEEADCAAPPA